jgi:hypothetical protein
LFHAESAFWPDAVGGAENPHAYLPFISGAFSGKIPAALELFFYGGTRRGIRRVELFPQPQGPGLCILEFSWLRQRAFRENQACFFRIFCDRQKPSLKFDLIVGDMGPVGCLARGNLFDFCNGAAISGQVGGSEKMIALDELPRGTQRLN